MMCSKLGLPGRNVDSDRAIGLASLACEAKRERVLDGIAVPAFGDYLAPSHLVQKMRSATRRMLLLSGGEIGGAHDLARDVAPAAFADAHTACRRMGERVVVGSVGEMGVQLPRFVGEP